MKSQTRSNVILFTTTFAIAFALTQVATTFAGTFVPAQGVTTFSGAGIPSVDIDATVKKIAPMQAHRVNLGNHTAVIYYTKLEDGDFNVVTTIGPNIGVEGSITQHQLELSPGQQYSINVDQGAATEVALTVEAESGRVAIY